MVQDVNMRQYIEQQQPGQGQPPLLRRSVWLEAGSVNLNLITADIALAADHPAKCDVQRHFLELHDAQTRRSAADFLFQGQTEPSSATALRYAKLTANLTNAFLLNI